MVLKANKFREYFKSIVSTSKIWNKIQTKNFGINPKHSIMTYPKIFEQKREENTVFFLF